MKKIDIEAFGPGEQVWFNIGRLRRVEEITKQPIGNVLKEAENISLKTLLALLMVGMRQDGIHDEKYYSEKIDKALDQGYGLADIIYPVLKAVAASGIMGKAAYYQFFPEELSAEAKKDVEAEKN